MTSGNFSFIVAIAVQASVSILQASEPIVHQVNSTRQSAMTSVRILLPDRLPGDDEPRLPVVYVLPVEAGDGTRWGDSLAEVQLHDLPNKHHTVFVFPRFSNLPWYADHPENTQLQQEAYLLQTMCRLRIEWRHC